jgi:hypothetical protein
VATRSSRLCRERKCFSHPLLCLNPSLSLHPSLHQPIDALRHIKRYHERNEEERNVAREEGQALDVGERNNFLLRRSRGGGGRSEEDHEARQERRYRARAVN